MKIILKSKSGFTLVELLIVVVIIGILATISIPIFRDYTIRGFNSAAVSDLRNFKSQMEASFSEQHSYPAF